MAIQGRGRRRSPLSNPVIIVGLFIFFGLILYLNYFMWVHFGKKLPTPGGNGVSTSTTTTTSSSSSRSASSGIAEAVVVVADGTANNAGGLKLPKLPEDAQLGVDKKPVKTVDAPPAPFQRILNLQKAKEEKEDAVMQNNGHHGTPAASELPDGTAREEEAVNVNRKEEDLQDENAASTGSGANGMSQNSNNPQEDADESEPEDGLVAEQKKEKQDDDDNATEGAKKDDTGKVTVDAVTAVPAKEDVVVVSPDTTDFNENDDTDVVAKATKRPHHHVPFPEGLDLESHPRTHHPHTHHPRTHSPHSRHHRHHGHHPAAAAAHDEENDDSEEKKNNHVVAEEGRKLVAPAGDDLNGIESVNDDDEEKDAEVEHMAYETALQMYHDGLKHSGKQDNDVTNDFTSVHERPNHGVLLPHDIHQPPDHRWTFCDPSDTDFTDIKDKECQGYLSNLNNMRSIKAMSSELYNGRTIKFKLYYHHNGIEALVKVSQKKFVFEASSEYLAFTVDRILKLARVPPTAYVPLPLDYLKASSGVLSPFFATWFENFVPLYDYTKKNLYKMSPHGGLYTNVTVQVWMNDVHSALYTKLALNYRYDAAFLNKFYVIGGYEKASRGKHWPPRENQLKAVSDVCDRFIFDFILGNTDRGMNDHNNFVYGGCLEHGNSQCVAPPLKQRTKQDPKYAFLDHGSSFYSHKEPEDNPFTGNSSVTLICRFKKSTYLDLKEYSVENKAKHDGSTHPLIHEAKLRLPDGIFQIAHYQTFAWSQVRLNKVVQLIEACVATHGETKVFSLI